MGRPVGTGGQARELSSRDIRRISNSLIGTRHEHRNRAIFFLGLGSGMRISEIVGLQLCDIMTQSGEFLDEIVLEKHSTKSKRSRTVPISKQSREYILRYLDHVFGVGWLPHEASMNVPLFATLTPPYNKGLTPNAAAHLMRRIFKDAGVANASSHSMRRTFGNTLRKNGVDLKTIQELLGHASIATTEIYLGVSSEEKKTAVVNLKF